MAPEQAQGKSRELGPPVDVYALRAILYEMLTGRPPFRGETPLDTLQQVVGQEPVHFRLNPKVPRDLETICLKCLEKLPARRYPSAAALADDVQRFRNGEPIRARPADPWERARKWGRRRPAVAALVGVSTAAAFGLLAVILWSYGRVTRERVRVLSWRTSADRGKPSKHMAKPFVASRTWSVNIPARPFTGMNWRGHSWTAARCFRA